jgi:zinc/manganese transport system ATP-binding protein
LGAVGGVRRGASVTLSDVTLGYGGETVLRGVDGKFEPGALTALIGPNGAGKSSLLKAIVGDLPLRGGRILVEGGETAYLPQQAALDRDFPISVGDVAAMGLWRRIGMARRMSDADRASVKEALAQAGLPDHAGRSIRDLSVGQFQRLLFARLIAQDADLLLLDEPFAAIDEAARGDLMRLIQGWSRDGRTVICVLHDRDLVQDAFPRACRLDQGRADWGDTAQVLARAPVYA